MPIPNPTSAATPDLIGMMVNYLRGKLSPAQDEQVTSAASALAGPENPPVHMALNAMNKLDPMGMSAMVSPMMAIGPRELDAMRKAAEIMREPKPGYPRLTEARRDILFDRKPPANDPMKQASVAPIKPTDRYISPQDARVVSGEYFYPASEGADPVAWRLQAMRDEALRQKSLKEAATRKALASPEVFQQRQDQLTYKRHQAWDSHLEAVEASKAAAASGDFALMEKLREKAKAYADLEKAYGDVWGDPTTWNVKRLDERLEWIKKDFGE